MKRLSRVFVGVLTIVISVGTVSAQTEKGDKEFSIAASFSSWKPEDANETWWAANLATRLGFFATGKIEIEPEIILSKWKDEDPGFVFSGNLAYNLSPIASGSKTVPFVLGGLGFSNTTVVLGNITWPSFEDKGWIVLNLGSGLKIFLPKPVAIRLGYRFQKLFGDRDYSKHYILLGISIFR